jgi:hypothetical protein
MLYNCLVCGHVISDSALRCVGCGAGGAIARQPSISYRPATQSQRLIRTLAEVPLIILAGFICTAVLLGLPILGSCLPGFWPDLLYLLAPSVVFGVWLGVLLSPLRVYLKFRKSISGPCPFCSREYEVKFDAFTCDQCQNRIFVRGGRYECTPKRRRAPFRVLLRTALSLAARVLKRGKNSTSNRRARSRFCSQPPAQWMPTASVAMRNFAQTIALLTRCATASSCLITARCAAICGIHGEGEA